jgi:hypothetical protein
MGRRGRAIVGLAVVAAAIVVVVGAVMLSGGDSAPPPGPVVAVQDDHLPVDPIETIPSRLDLLAKTGVTTTRVDIFWADVAPTRPADPADPDDPAYDFAREDMIFTGLAKRHITPIVSVYNTPAWAAGGRSELQGNRVNTAAPDPEAFGDFMAAVATRYSGDFAGPDGSTLPAVDHWEIWNEPNLSGFLCPAEPGTQARVDEYVRMDRAAYPLIKRANPRAIVIAGVGGPRSSTSATGVSALEWLRALRSAQIPLDAYSQHIYPAAPPEAETSVVPSWSTVGRRLDELDAWHTPAPLPLYITEAGYTTASTVYRPGRAITPQQQADYLREIYRLPQLRTDRIKAVVWFNLQDNAGWPAGLLDAEGRRKPSWSAFEKAVKAQKGRTLSGG